MTATDTRAEWLQWRRSGIGASDIGALLGISPWASPWSVWADKLGLLPDDQLDDDDPREFGRRAEAMVAPWFHDKTGLYVIGEQLWASNPAEPWMLATPDGVVAEGPHTALADALGGLEIKATNDRPWHTIPEHYQAQGQWQMAVCGWERVWFAVLHYRRLRIYELPRDQADIDYMTSRAREFWLRHVLTGEPPEVDGSEATAAAIAAIYPTTTKGETADLDDVAGAFAMLAQAKADRKDAEAREDAAGNVIRWAMADAEEGRVRGLTACSLKSQTRKTTCQHCGAVDESAPFKVLRPSKEFA